MELRVKPALDATDWSILEALQQDARISVAALGRQVHLGPTATTERLNRLRDSGVVTGYRAVVDPAALGLTFTAFIRMRTFQGTRRAFAAALDRMPTVRECHHITGEDCYLLKVVARDMLHLEAVTEQIAGYGETTTSVVYSEPLTGRAVTPEIVEDSRDAHPGHNV